jgi:D-amino peptidase
MKLFIMTDLEGASGVTGPKEELDPRTGRHFAEAVANLTHDANAAIEGALEAGVADITVLDGDGRRFTLSRDKLNPAAKLLQGARTSELAGFDGSYEAVFVIGAHSMAGTLKGYLNHTFMSATIQNLWLNGQKTGEVGIWAAWVGAEGVPVVLVSGDEAAVREARGILAETETVCVKEGVTRYYALSYPRPQVAESIRSAARRAIQRRGKIPPYRPSRPFELKIEYMDSQIADHIAHRPGVAQVDGRTVKASGMQLSELMALLFP